MKVLAIMGSPLKHGNTYKVVKRVEEEMKGQGEVDFEYLFLAEALLEDCRGCFNCVTKGESLCPLDDDRDAILEKMLQADGLVLASPVYAWNVTALMKNFLDRFAYLAHRPQFFGKPVLVVVTSGGGGHKDTADYLARFASGLEARVAGKLLAWTPPYPLAQKEVYKLESSIDSTASKFYKALKKTPRPTPGLTGLLHFRFMRYHSILERYYYPADYDYFRDRGLLDMHKKYYVEARINPFLDLMARCTEHMMKPVMRKALDKRDVPAEELPDGSGSHKEDQA